MTAWQQDVQRRGVVAAVMAIKHAAKYRSGEDKFESNFLLSKFLALNYIFCQLRLCQGTGLFPGISIFSIGSADFLGFGQLNIYFVPSGHC